MSHREERVIGSFVATDGNGNQHTVIISQTFIHSTLLNGESHETPGMKSLALDDGRAVNCVDQGKYEIVGRPMIPLTSDDPEAP